MPKINYAKLYTLRSDGRYQGYWRDERGVRHTVCDRDPERLHRRIEEKTRPTEITFRLIADGWKAEAVYEDKTWDCYEAAYNRAVERFGDRVASTITTAEIYQQLKELAQQNYSARTVKAQRSVYSLIYKWAANDTRYTQEITTNPAAMAALPKVAKKAVPRTAPEDDVVDQIRAKASEVPYGILATIYMNTGFRRGEALALQWKDVDFEKKRIDCSKSVTFSRGTMKVKAPKTEAGNRWVPLLPELEAALLPLRGDPNDFVLHCEDPKKPIVETTYRRWWLSYCKAMGFVTVTETPYTTPDRGIERVKKTYKPTLTAHVLRHGYATMLFEADVDVYTAQQLLGHADVETTMSVYTHLRDRQRQKSVDKLIAHISECQ